MNSRLALGNDAISQAYYASIQPDRWMRAELWQRFGVLFQHADHLFDVGCGTGEDSLFFARNQDRVSALDLSQSMIERLHWKAQQAGLEGMI